MIAKESQRSPQPRRSYMRLYVLRRCRFFAQLAKGGSRCPRVGISATGSTCEVVRA